MTTGTPDRAGGAAAVLQSFNRIEKKYLVTPAQKERMLSRMAAYTKESVYSRYTIGNIYYDTPDFTLLRASIESPVYKEKFRLRSYKTPGAGDEVFLEIKKKFKGVVYKRRDTMEYRRARYYLATRRGGGGQIGREIDWFLNWYKPEPKAMIAYEREAYEGLEDPELRITFDTGLRWRDTDLDLGHGTYGAPLLEGDTVLVEIKIPGAAPLWLAGLLSELEMHPVSISKIGTWYRDCYMKGKRFQYKEEVRHSA